MYSLILLAVTFGAVISYPTLQQPGSHVPRCAQPPVAGLCLAYFPSFFYNPETGECDSFVYGGCQGNENRFATREECFQACKGFKIEKKEFELRTEDEELAGGEALEAGSGGAAVQPEEHQPSAARETDPCHQPAQSGPCRAFLPRFYYNGDDCVNFVYGGCEGNENNFKSAADCEQKCKTTVSGEASESEEEPSRKSEEPSSTSEEEPSSKSEVEPSSISVEQPSSKSEIEASSISVEQPSSKSEEESSSKSETSESASHSEEQSSSTTQSAPAVSNKESLDNLEEEFSSTAS